MQVKEILTTFVRETVSYLQLRGELAGLEGQEAASLFVKKGIRFLIGGLILLQAYLLLLVSSVAALGYGLEKLGEGLFFGWIGAAVSIAGLHILIGLIFILRARRPIRQPLFPLTRDQWVKDQQWIQQTKTKNES